MQDNSNPNPMDEYLKIEKIGQGSNGCSVYLMKNLNNGNVSKYNI